MDDDELEEMMMRGPSTREAVKIEHETIKKAASHPLRRKVIESIGVFGKTGDQIKENVDIDDNGLKYHTDFLINSGFLLLEDGTYKLTEKGINLLSDMSSASKAR